ncbi:TlpA family protein disulfide reductase [Marinigracilibium pacificum]|uniref:TlpA family protein disulfide reductase n=1 Tax=Marinigracilibium pacificum TaxID=2729599 RepID=A0A848IXV6_9BACT|nr:TlpA disulfide reductase family protein [Marinigracilibium pacificum]NMM47110.1 TlpA family protein disulfide reductase [Marinigracilibium pacificum]
MELKKICLFLFLSINFISYGQKVEKVEIDDLEKLLNQSSDKVLIFNFWATWCKPCIKEIPAFEEINSTRSEDAKVYLVSIDFKNQYDNRVVPFVEDKGIKSQVLFLDEDNPNIWMPRISNEWSGAIPSTLFIYNKKKYFVEKEFTLEELNEYINKLRK